MGYIYLGKNTGTSIFFSSLLLILVLGLVVLVSNRDNIRIAPDSQRSIISSARKADSDYSKKEWYELYLEKYANGRYSSEAESFLLDYYESNGYGLKDYEQLRDRLPGTVFSDRFDSLVKEKQIRPF